MSESNVKFTRDEALDFHSRGRPGKIEIIASKPMATQRDLSLAYSPGVAVPVEAIADDPGKAYDFTAKGNLVAVISNGTAILGLGNLGALASKPVMEGKAVLFKRFADVDSIDLEVDTDDAQRFIDAVELLGPSFGGINLEDIAAPDCFIIEQALKERMNIPVFHDDQHGTAIITAAGLINACFLTGRELKDIRVVVNGAGAAAIACTELIKAMGVPHDNVIMCDRKGVALSRAATAWTSASRRMRCRPTRARLKEALVGADVFLGLSRRPARSSPTWSRRWRRSPIIFAMANPDPEITPPEAKAARPDAIVATGRSDYPNQVNNVLGFPFIFRGALDVRATGINEEMKIAAAHALAELAREPVPEEVAAAYGGVIHRFGPDYIIPAPFDPRLIEIVPAPWPRRRWTAAWRKSRSPTWTPIARRCAPGSTRPLRCSTSPTKPRGPIPSGCCSRRARSPMCFAPRSPSRKAAMARRCWSGATMSTTCWPNWVSTIRKSYEVFNSRNSPLVGRAVDFIYAKHQRHGMLRRAVERMVNQDRNTFAAAMLALGEGDAMITGTTRPFSQSLNQVRWVIDDEDGADPVRGPRRRRARPDRDDRRHGGDRAADRRAAGGDRDPLGRLCPAHGAGTARRLHQLHDVRQPAGAAHRGVARRGEAARHARDRLRI